MCTNHTNEEDRIIEISSKLKQQCPKVSTQMYLNSLMNFYWYKVHHEFEGANASQLLHDINGQLVRVRQDGGNPNQTVWDWGQAATKEKFLALVDRATASGITSFFLDKASTSTSENGTRICNHVCATLLESVGKAWDAGHLEVLRAVQARSTGPTVGNGGSVPCAEMQGCHGGSGTADAAGIEKLVRQLKQPGLKALFVQFPKTTAGYAAFLMGHQQGKSWLWWYNAASHFAGWIPEFNRTLGAPVGAAKLSSSGVYTRNFSSGTVVSFDTKTNQGHFAWAEEERSIGSDTVSRPAPAGSAADCTMSSGCGMHAAGPKGLAETNASSWSACCADCVAHAECTQWAWSASQKPPCHLHDIRAHQVPAKDHVCGFLPGTPTPPPSPPPPPSPSPSPPTPSPASKLAPVIHLSGTNGDAVGLLYNPYEQRYEVMWDTGGGTGWGHASTSDFLKFTRHGNTGPTGAGGMSGSVAFGGGPNPRPMMAYTHSNKDAYVARAANASMAWFTQENPLPALNKSQCPVDITDIRDPYMWKDEASESVYLLAGGGGAAGPHALLWTSIDSPAYQTWTFVGELWSGDANKYCRITSCVDTFKLPTSDGASNKTVFLFSDFVLHRVRWLVGTQAAPSAKMVVEKEGIVDMGRLYATQSMWDSNVGDVKRRRRLLMGNIGHPHWMAGPNDLTIPIFVDSSTGTGTAGKGGQMISLPREIRLDSTNAVVFAPARELQAARMPEPFSIADQVVHSGQPLLMGQHKGSTREVRLTLQHWLHATPMGMCGFRLNASACALVVGFTTESVLVQSSCGNEGAYAAPLQCPMNADDATGSASHLAGYCYNATLSRASTANETLTAIVDRSVVEVFADGGRLVISSGVFLSEGTDAASLELYCDRGAGAVLGGEAWGLKGAGPS